MASSTSSFDALAARTACFIVRRVFHDAIADLRRLALGRSLVPRSRAHKSAEYASMGMVMAQTNVGLLSIYDRKYGGHTVHSHRL